MTIEANTHTDDEQSTTDFSLGDEVLDRDALGDDPNTEVVVARPDEPAYARVIEDLDGSPSVADLNPEYAASGPVATVAYAGDLDRALDVWREANSATLARICADHEVRTYDFPTARLRRVSIRFASSLT